MGGFDPFIEELWVSADVLGARHPRREYHWPGSAEAAIEGLCVKVGPGANPGIILRGETFVEVGNPIAGSPSMWPSGPPAPAMSW